MAAAKVLFTIQAVRWPLQYGWSVKLTAQGQDTFDGSIVTYPDAPITDFIDDEIIFGVDFGRIWDATYTFGYGAKMFHVAPDLGFEIGMRVRMVHTETPGHFDSGIVTAYQQSVTYPWAYELHVTVDVLRTAYTTIAASLVHVTHVIFGGEVEEPTLEGFGDSGDGTMITHLNTRAFNLWRQNVYVNGVFFKGTVKQALQLLVNLFLLYDYDVGLHPAQDDGPMLPDMTLPFVRFDDVMKQIEGYSQYRIGLDQDKLLRAWDPMTLPAPFNVETGNGSYFGSPTITRSRSAAGADYANRVYVVWGGTPATIRRTDIASHTAANPTVISTAAPHQLFNNAIVTISDNVGAVESINDSGLIVTVVNPTAFVVARPIGTSTTSMAVAATGTLSFAMAANDDFVNGQTVIVHRLADQGVYMRGVGNYAAGQIHVNVAQSAGSGTFNDWKIIHQLECTVAGTGGTFIRTDDLSVPIYAQADNLAEQIDVHMRMAVFTDVKLTSQAQAQAAADSILAMRSMAPRTLTYLTFRHGLRPGMVQSVDLPEFSFVNSTCMITEVSVAAWENSEIFYTVSLIEGSIFQGSWQDVYKSWSGSTTAVGGVTGSATTGGQHTLYPLGGSNVEFVQSPTPTWVTATAARITVDTVERGSTTGIVKIRLRASGGSVQARLFNVSLNTPCPGTSIVVTSATWPAWSTSAFAVTLNGGTYDYELQVLPSLANTDVAAWGYLT